MIVAHLEYIYAVVLAKNFFSRKTMKIFQISSYEEMHHFQPKMVCLSTQGAK